MLVSKKQEHGGWKKNARVTISFSYQIEQKTFIEVTATFEGLHVVTFQRVKKLAHTCFGLVCPLDISFYYIQGFPRGGGGGGGPPGGGRESEVGGGGGGGGLPGKGNLWRGDFDDSNLFQN